MCWAYVIGRASSSVFKVNVNPYLLLFLGALPDIDLLFGVFGIQHRTWTQSILVWSIVFTPLFIMYRKRSIPYFLAPIQHIIFGDAIVGTWNRPLWPISHFNFSLGYSLLSIENIALEAAGLALFLLLAFTTNDGRKGLFGNNRRRALSILPIAPLVGFVIFMFSFSRIEKVLVDSGILAPSRLLESTAMLAQQELFPYALAMHLILISILSASLLWGFKINTKLKVDRKS